MLSSWTGGIGENVTYRKRPKRSWRKEFVIGGELLSGENYGGCKMVFNVMNEAGVEIGSGLLD